MDRHRDNKLSPACLAVACSLLAGCAAPELYSNKVQLDYQGAQRPASIQYSDPKLFQRHALINERREEEAYLKKQLENSADATFAPDLARDVESIRAMSLALGLSFDAGIRDAARATTETNDIAQQIAVENLKGKLAQVQRDVELLKAKLSEQTAPSATAFDQKPTAVTGVTLPAASTNKELATELSNLITALKAQLDRAATGPRAVGVGGSPREVFQDRQAYRRELQANINANALDALHDIGSNSLFRLQFQAMAMPESARKKKTGEEADSDANGRQLGLLEMSVKRPSIETKDLQRELRALYFQWLDYATTNLNLQAEAGDLQTDRGLLQLGMEGRVMSIVVMNTGKALGPAAAGKESQDSASPTLPPLNLSQFEYRRKSELLSKRNLSLWKGMQKLMTVDAGGKEQPLPAATVADAKKPATCHLGPVTQAQAEQAAQCELLSIAYPPTFDSNVIARLMEATAPEAVKTLETAVDAFIKGLGVSQQAAACVGAEFKDTKNVEDLFHNRERLRRLQRALSWSHLKSGTIDPLASEGVATMISAIAKALRLVERASNAAQEHGCKDDLFAHTDEALVPKEFIEALFVPPQPAATPAQAALDASAAKPASDRWTARGRLSVYAVTPTALVQHVSTAARAADAIQIAASLAASLPTKGLGGNAGLGYMRSVTGKVDALERIPLVVGYSSASRFDSASIERRETAPARVGWLLGPRVVIDTEKKALALEHNLSPYELSADISMPGWWPQIELESLSAWSPEGDLATGRLLSDEPAKWAQRLDVVPIRHTPSDMGGITQLLLGGTQNDGEGGGIGLRLPFAAVRTIDPPTVSDCATSTTFVVKGNNLWRAATAYLSGVEQTRIAVMPDMGGLIITFDISKLQAAAGDARLIIPTPDGDAAGTIHVLGDRSSTTACGVGEPDDGKPKISAILPESIFACETNQRLILKGKHFSEVESASLGNLPVTFDRFSGDKKLLELLLVGKVGSHGGTQATLPLVVRMKEGTAVANVRIERGNCSGTNAAASALVLTSGPIDVCVPASTTSVIGKSAKRIAGARLVSTLPKFELKAKSVKFNASTQTSDIEFVGVPKAGITGPDQLASPLKLVLSMTKGADLALDLPAVCSAYAAGK